MTGVGSVDWGMYLVAIVKINGPHKIVFGPIKDVMEANESARLL